METNINTENNLIQDDYLNSFYELGYISGLLEKQLLIVQEGAVDDKLKEYKKKFRQDSIIRIGKILYHHDKDDFKTFTSILDWISKHPLFIALGGIDVVLNILGIAVTNGWFQYVRYLYDSMVVASSIRESYKRTKEINDEIEKENSKK